jgi:hypothetical protein
LIKQIGSSQVCNQQVVKRELGVLEVLESHYHPQVTFRRLQLGVLMVKAFLQEGCEEDWNKAKIRCNHEFNILFLGDKNGSFKECKC